MRDRGLPALAWDAPAPLEVSDVRPLGSGDFCVCWLVNGTHVVRVARHAEASAALRREARLLPRLDVGVDIPRIVGEGIAVESGERFVCYPLVPGDPVTPELLASVDATRRASLVRQMAEAVARLHRTPLEVARACGLPEVDPRRELPALVQRTRGALSGRLPSEAWTYHERLLDLYLSTPDLHDFSPAVLHGDLSPDHVLGDVERGIVTGLIDFGDCRIGDPCWDLVYVLEDYGADVLDLWLTFHSPAPAAATRVRIYQQLNNVDWCLSRLAEGDEEGVDEAIGILVEQAASASLV